jgi:putative ABC transport system permease protein
MGLDVPARAEIYMPYRQIATQPWFTPRDLVVRTAGDPALAVDAVSRVVHSVDPGLAISNVRPLDDVLDEEVASRRVGTTLLISFAVFALVLAIVGLYGVIAYFVVQHVPEMGVRIALGARAGDILRFVIARGMSLAVVGVFVGTAVAIVLPRIMASLLYGVTTGGILIWFAASLLLLMLSLVASYLPARRATRLDPMAALRPQ